MILGATMLALFDPRKCTFQGSSVGFSAEEARFGGPTSGAKWTFVCVFSPSVVRFEALSVPALRAHVFLQHNGVLWCSAGPLAVV
jgi:hypothetical protein